VDTVFLAKLLYLLSSTLTFQLLFNFSHGAQRKKIKPTPPKVASLISEKRQNDKVVELMG
jgi:hypothetical protein